MKASGIRIPDFRISKAGNVERDQKRLPVNLRLQKQASKKVRVARRTAPR